MTFLPPEMSGAEFKAWRKEQFLSQAQIAGLLGVHINTITNWEKGRTRVPRQAILAMEALSAQRERIVRKLRERQARIAHLQRMKAIRQDVRIRREAFQAGKEAGKLEAMQARMAHARTAIRRGKP